MMNDQNDNKWWYKENIYIIPAIILGLFLLFDSDKAPIEPAELTSDQTGLSNSATPVKEVRVEQKSQVLSNCHPSYSGCLNPNASDYDCAGGSGNGPYYTGPVQVLGYDEFGLDRDGDGWGCE